MRHSLLCIAPILLAAAALAQSVQETDVAFTAACDASQQHYVQLLPQPFDPAQPHDVLIALHGHGSDRWQYIRDPRDECRSARDAAVNHNMIFVSPDYRAKTSWMGPKAEADLVQIIEALKKNFRVNRIFLCGGSMGASSALTFAVLHPDLLAGVAAMNGTANHLEYENFQDAIAESFGGAKRVLPEEYKKRSAEYFPERLTMPVGITAGGKDELVPPGSVLRLGKILQLLGRNIQIIYRENSGHSTNYDDCMAILEYVITTATTRQ